jgi:hypothetical protein
MSGTLGSGNKKFRQDIDKEIVFSHVIPSLQQRFCEEKEKLTKNIQNNTNESFKKKM